MWESAGKPPRLGSHPGVVNRKVSVVRNVPTASPLPMAEPSGQTGRSAMSSPVAISTTPRSEENA